MAHQTELEIIQLLIVTNMLVVLIIAWILSLFGTSGAAALLAWAGEHLLLTIILIVLTA